MRNYWMSAFEPRILETRVIEYRLPEWVVGQFDCPTKVGRVVGSLKSANLGNEPEL
jgi:hypothetical protein